MKKKVDERYTCRTHSHTRTTHKATNTFTVLGLYKCIHTAIVHNTHIRFGIDVWATMKKPVPFVIWLRPVHTWQLTDREFGWNGWILQVDSIWWEWCGLKEEEGPSRWAFCLWKPKRHTLQLLKRKTTRSYRHCTNTVCLIRMWTGLKHFDGCLKNCYACFILWIFIFELICAPAHLLYPFIRWRVIASHVRIQSSNIWKANNISKKV